MSKRLWVLFWAASVSGSASAAELDLEMVLKAGMLVSNLAGGLQEGRYHVRKTVVDANNVVIGQPLRDSFICINGPFAVSAPVMNYAATFEAPVKDWMAAGATCEITLDHTAQQVKIESHCATTPTMSPPSRWNVLEPEPSCKYAYGINWRTRECSSGKPPKRETNRADHYRTSVMATDNALRVELLEFDSAAGPAKFVLGHAVELMQIGTTCNNGDDYPLSVTDNDNSGLSPSARRAQR
jgi:hypothetical protein